jgi:hypothetical protein
VTKKGAKAKAKAGAAEDKKGGEEKKKKKKSCQITPSGTSLSGGRTPRFTPYLKRSLGQGTCTSQSQYGTKFTFLTEIFFNL